MHSELLYSTAGARSHHHDPDAENTMQDLASGHAAYPWLACMLHLRWRGPARRRLHLGHRLCLVHLLLLRLRLLVLVQSAALARHLLRVRRGAAARHCARHHHRLLVAIACFMYNLSLSNPTTPLLLKRWRMAVL